jgi:hypothetical protein
VRAQFLQLLWHRMGLDFVTYGFPSHETQANRREIFKRFKFTNVANARIGGILEQSSI